MWATQFIHPPYIDAQIGILHYITIVIPKQGLFSTVIGRFSTENDGGLAVDKVRNRDKPIYGGGLPDSQGSKQGS